MRGAGRLVRVISAAEAVDDSCFEPSCDLDPSFVVTTPSGAVATCEEHLERLVDSLPEQFVRERSADLDEDIHGVPV